MKHVDSIIGHYCQEEDGARFSIYTYLFVIHHLSTKLSMGISTTYRYLYVQSETQHWIPIFTWGDTNFMLKSE